jgi:hypothetical protein
MPMSAGSMEVSVDGTMGTDEKLDTEGTIEFTGSFPGSKELVQKLSSASEDLKQMLSLSKKINSEAGLFFRNDDPDGGIYRALVAGIETLLKKHDEGFTARFRDLGEENKALCTKEKGSPQKEALSEERNAFNLKVKTFETDLETSQTTLDTEQVAFVAALQPLCVEPAELMKPLADFKKDWKPAVDDQGTESAPVSSDGGGGESRESDEDATVPAKGVDPARHADALKRMDGLATALKVSLPAHRYTFWGTFLEKVWGADVPAEQQQAGAEVKARRANKGDRKGCRLACRDDAVADTKQEQQGQQDQKDGSPQSRTFGSAMLAEGTLKPVPAGRGSISPPVSSSELQRGGAQAPVTPALAPEPEPELQSGETTGMMSGRPSSLQAELSA